MKKEKIDRNKINSYNLKVMPYSVGCCTPLSNFEAGQNYKDVHDPAVLVSFPLVDDPKVKLVAWTTTPWTLPSNLSLCVNQNSTYVKILGNIHFII
jgi:isoleucyl-tRNA synthetase